MPSSHRPHSRPPAADHRRLLAPATVRPAFLALCLGSALLGAGVAAAAASRAVAEPDVERLREDGRDALRFGEYEEALEAYEALLASTEHEVEARLGVAAVHMATGKWDRALEAIDGYSRLDGAPALLARKGAVYLRTGRLESAESVLEQAVALDPRSSEILYLLGEARRQRGKLEASEQAFRRSIDVYRAMSREDAERLSPDAFVYWAKALVALNRFRDAHDIMFPQAEELDDENAFMLVEWARTIQSKYNFPDPREMLREVLDENPRHADALVTLAENYLLDFQVGTKRFEQADKYIARALDVHPGHAGALTQRGLIWFYDGDYEKAKSDFNEALEENPAYLPALGLLAACHHLEGETAEYEKVEARALAVNPRAAEFYHTIAIAIEKKFRYPECVMFCDRALAVDADYWPAYATLAINCLRTGEDARGRRMLEKSWDHDRFNVWVNNTREFLRHLDKNLESFENERFIFFLPRGDAAALRPYLEPLMDEAFRNLSERYRVELSTPIRIECFSDHQWFSARTVGLTGFAASGACFGKLVTLTTPRALPQNWGAVAWHEFAHVVTLQLTDYRIPRWLTEGISVYEEGFVRPQWTRNFQREIADAWASGYILPMAELDLGFSKPKFPMQILLSYYQGCMVVEYISGKWGFDAILEVLRGYRDHKPLAQIFTEVLEEDLEAFDRGFNDYVQAWIQRNGYTPQPSPAVVPALELRHEAEPENVEMLNELAWAYLATGNETDAAIKVGKALKLDEESGDAHAILGMVRLREKKPALARGELEKALELGTRFRYRVNAFLGDILVGEKDSRGAMERYEAAKKISPVAGAGHPPGGGNLYYKLAKLYESEGQPEAAIRQMEELAGFAVEDPECRLRLIKYALETGKSEMAARYLKEIIYINPFDMQLHRWYAEVAEALGDHDTVIREITILLGDPRTNTLKAHLSLAKAHLGKGEAEKARKEARVVLEIDPENDEARAVLEKAGESAGGS